MSEQVKCAQCGEPTACGKILCEEHCYQQPVSAQPAGEVPKTVAWKRTDYSDCVTDNAGKVDDWRHCSDISGPILELIDKAQHTRIVAALQSDADRWKFYAPKVAELMGITIEYMTAEIDEARLNGKGGV